MGIDSPSVAEAPDELEHPSSLDNFVARRIREPGPMREEVILDSIIIRECREG